LAVKINIKPSNNSMEKIF